MRGRSINSNLDFKRLHSQRAGVTIKNRIALLSSILLAVREVLFEQRRQDLGSERRLFYLRFWLRNLRFAHVISRTRPSRFSTYMYNIKS